MAESASECNACFRTVLQSNHEVKHVHQTMSSQVSGQPCLLHPHAEGCKLPEGDLCVFGTPCPPYSSQRSKRYVEGTVKQHPLWSVTFVDAVEMLVKHSHKAVVMEQVPGFDKVEASGLCTEETPMSQFPEYQLPTLILYQRRRLQALVKTNDAVNFKGHFIDNNVLNIVCFNQRTIYYVRSAADTALLCSAAAAAAEVPL